MSAIRPSATSSWPQRHLPKLLIALVATALLAGGAYFAMRKAPVDSLAQAQALRQKGDFKGAVIELKNVVQKSPDSAPARFLLGQALFGDGNYPAAEKELRKARELGGGNNDDLDVLLARTLLELNQPERVIEDINVRDGMPANAEAAVLALRAQALFIKGNSEEALSALGEAEKKAPKHPETLLTRALIAQSQGDKAAALGFVDSALGKDTSRVDLWVLKGGLLHALDRQQDAQAAYSEALVREPGNIAAHQARIQYYLDTSALDKAADELKTLRKYSPENLLGYYLDAVLEFRRGQYTASYNKLQIVYQSAPDFLPAHLLGGAVSLALGKREEAQSHLNRILNIQPDHPTARQLMAGTLLDLGQVDQAKAAIRGLQGTGDTTVLSILRGGTSLREGNYAQARQELEKAAASPTATPALYLELAASQQGLGDTEAMIKSITKAAELDKTSARADFLLVTANLKNKRYDAAFKAVENLEKKKLSPALVHNVRGVIHVAKNDLPQARASFAKALEADPAFMSAASNLARLDIVAKDYKAARSRFERVLKHAPNDSRAWLGLAKIAAIQKDGKGYLESLEKAKRAAGKEAEPRQLLIRYWLSMNNPGQALAEAREALTATGQNAFYELIGLAMARQGDALGAFQTFQRWANDNPGSALALTRLAGAQADAGKRGEALQSLEKALAAQPDFLDAKTIKMSLLVQEKRGNEALAIARALQAKYPKAAIGYLGEAEALAAGMKHLEAARLYAKAAQMANQGQPLVRAYESYSAGGQATEGARVLEQWLQSRPDDVLVRHVWASALDKLQRKKEAVAQYRVLLKANPADMVASNNLAWLLSELKDPGALAAAEQAYKISPDNHATQDTLGWVLIQSGQGKRGITLLKQAFDKVPESVDYQWHYAKGLIAIGEPILARQELDRLLTRGKNFPQAEEARKLMESLKR